MSYVSKAVSYGSERQIWPTPVYPARGVRGMDSYVEYGTPTSGVTGAVNQAMSTFTGMSDALKVGLVGVGAYLFATKTRFGKRIVGAFK